MNGDPGDEEKKETYHPCVKSRKLELHSLKEESDMEKKRFFYSLNFLK